MISAEHLVNTKLRNIFLFRYKVSLQKFIEAVFVYTFFYDLRNVGPNPGSPMNYRFFCNRIIYIMEKCLYLTCFHSNAEDTCLMHQQTFGLSEVRI